MAEQVPPQGAGYLAPGVQNVHVMRPDVRAEYERLGRPLAADDAFHTRLVRFFTELRDPLAAVYGDDPRLEPALAGLLEAMARTAATRTPELKALDHEREITPDWLQREQALGYVTYADRFAGTLQGVRERLPYLRELGVSYLHLMPLLRMRPEPNDGGYAVADYGEVEPSLGTMDDLRALASDLHASGMALCVDVVVNHTAREHAWARAAVAGDPDKLAYYRTFEDRTEPDAYEATLPEVFPDIAPGSFTFAEELGRWVWTTFNEFQWDLDYTNPDVFRAMAEAMLGLAGAGVDVLRLDAVPFLWKRKGTDSQNQPEVHQLLQAFRAALRIAAPGRGVQGRGDRLPARARALPRRRAPRGQGVRPRLPQRADGAGLERARLGVGRAAHAHPGGDAARPARRGLGDLRALPRRHRLGDHGGGRRAGGRGRAPAPQVPQPTSTRASSRARSRAAPASSPSRSPARRARAAAPPRSPGWRPRSSPATRSRRSSRSGACCCCTRSRSPTAGCRCSTWATSSACATTRRGRRSPRTPPTTAGCTGRRWTGRRRRAATTRRPSRGACGRG